jgi:hypothetical protein
MAPDFHEKDKDYFWRFFSVLGGMYGLFLFETTANLFLRKQKVEVDIQFQT